VYQDYDEKFSGFVLKKIIAPAVKVVSIEATQSKVLRRNNEDSSPCLESA